MNSFDKAALPHKVYLTGADCFHLVLDKHAKKHAAGGNVMRKIFYFRNCIPATRINEILNSSPVIYWLCNITLVRDRVFSKPYWAYADYGNKIILNEHLAHVENDIPPEILKRDIGLNSKRFIEADLVQYASGACAFILSWNHILLDAKGTTLLFTHLNNLAEKKPTDIHHFFPAKEKSVGIIAYISNMYKVKKFVQSSSKSPLSSVGTKHDKSSNGIIQYHLLHFTNTESRKIQENAFKAGSRFGPTLFFIACCAHSVNSLIKKQNKTGDIWLPVPYDGRLKGINGPLITNCVAFLFYRITQQNLMNIKDTVQNLSEQMTTQIKNRMPQKYTMFLNMMRYIPLWLYYYIVTATGEGSIASFLYTSTGDNFNELKSLFGEALSDLVLVPALTFPPGLTFVFLKHDDEFSVNITFSPDVISVNDLNLIEEKLKHSLLSDY